MEISTKRQQVIDFTKQNSDLKTGGYSTGPKLGVIVPNLGL